jgi:DNA polymerase-3 subunit alpha
MGTRLAHERETLGFYLSGHPMDAYRTDLTYIAPATIADVGGPKPAGGGGWGSPQRQVTVAGLVLEAKKRNNRTILTVDDGTGRLEVSLFDDMAQNHRELVVKDALIVVEGGLKWDDFSEGWRLSAKKLMGLESAREQQARRLLLRWPSGTEGQDVLARLEAALRPLRGGRCAVAVYYPGAAARVLLELSAEWNVRPTRALIDELIAQFGEDAVKLTYHPRDQEACLRAWGAQGKVERLPVAMHA